MNEDKAELAMIEFDGAVVKASVSLGALFGPFMLWLVETLLPYPALVEEMFKAGLIWYMMRSVHRRDQARWAVIIGFLFGVSETIFYVLNAFKLDDLGVLWGRVLLTIPMHMLTAYIMYWGFKRKKGWLGIGMAIVVHGGFNVIVARVY